MGKKYRKESINLLFDAEAENSKHIVSRYMCNIKEGGNMYTDAHRHTHRHKVILQRKKGHTETIFRVLRVWLVL